MSDLIALADNYPLNSLDMPGMYSARNPLDFPVLTGDFLVRVYGGNVQGLHRATQECWNTGTGAFYTRAKTSAGWSTWVQLSTGSAATGGGGGLTPLTADLELFLSPTGDDTTGDGSSTSPWRTLGRAWQYITQEIDTAGWYVVLNLEAGQYPAYLYAYSCPANCAGVYVRGVDGDSAAVTIYPAIFYGNITCPVEFSDLTFDTAQDPAVTADGIIGGPLTLRNIIYKGTYGGDAISLSGHVFARLTGITIDPDGGGSFGTFLTVAEGAYVHIIGNFTFADDTDFTNAFVYAETYGAIYWGGGGVMGGHTITGVKYQTEQGGRVFLPGGRSGVPGNLPPIDNTEPATTFQMSFDSSRWGTLVGGDELYRYIAPRTLTFNANFQGSFGTIGSVPTASYPIVVEANSVQLGTITIDTDGNFTFATTSGTEKTVSAGTVIYFYMPNTPDATADGYTIQMQARLGS